DMRQILARDPHAMVCHAQRGPLPTKSLFGPDANVDWSVGRTVPHRVAQQVVYCPLQSRPVPATGHGWHAWIDGNPSRAPRQLQVSGPALPQPHQVQGSEHIVHAPIRVGERYVLQVGDKQADATQGAADPRQPVSKMPRIDEVATLVAKLQELGIAE